MTRSKLHKSLCLESLESRNLLTGVALLVYGADAGALPVVRVFPAHNNTSRFLLQPFGSSFRGGVRVAVGDVNGDGQDDIITSPGVGGLPLVKVFNGLNGQLLSQFSVAPRYVSQGPTEASTSWQVAMLNADGYRGGINVAAGDVNGDGKVEVITGCDSVLPHIGIYNGEIGRQLAGVVAHGFSKGIQVASGDIEGDGKAEIIAGVASGGSQVQVLDGMSRVSELGFRAFSTVYVGGVQVAVCDTDADGGCEILVGTKGSGVIGVYDGRTGTQLRTIETDIPDGASLHIAAAHADNDQIPDIMVGSSGDNYYYNYDITGQRISNGQIPGFATGFWVACSSEQSRTNAHAGQVVTEWNNAALDAIRAERTPPPKVARALAIAHLAMFDAVRSITGGYQSYLITGSAAPGTSISAAIAQAAYTTLVTLFPTQQTQFEALLNSHLTHVTNQPARMKGVVWGQAVGNAYLQARTNDGADQAAGPYTPGTAPGVWQPTPPTNTPALLPGWGNVTPFGIANINAVLPAGPPDLASQEWADEFNQVKTLGAVDSAVRTADQTEIATFWADNAGTFTPPGHWNDLAQTLALTDGLSVLTTARLFAHLNMAMADAGIVAWKAKYTYNFWRPITAIRAADTDGNDQTDVDPTWTPLLGSPPFPDYVSGHSTFSGAADSVLTHYFGTNRTFDMVSDDGAVTRSFTSFTQAADEAGISRIYGGIHYWSADEDGLIAGRDIGTEVLAAQLG